MLRITELKLPIDHPEEDLRVALLKHLGIDSGELLDFTLFKRSYDARKSLPSCASSTPSTSVSRMKKHCCASWPMTATSARHLMSATKSSDTLPKG